MINGIKSIAEICQGKTRMMCAPFLDQWKRHVTGSIVASSMGCGLVCRFFLKGSVGF